MSQRQEQLRERLWNEIHKPEFDKRMADLRQLEDEIKLLPLGSAERAAKQIIYDEGLKCAEEYFMKFHE